MQEYAEAIGVGEEFVFGLRSALLQTVSNSVINMFETAEQYCSVNNARIVVEIICLGFNKTKINRQTAQKMNSHPFIFGKPLKHYNTEAAQSC